MKATLEELAALLGGSIAQGDPAQIITGFSSIQEAEPGEITFLGNSRYAPALHTSRASAVLTDEETEGLPAHMGVIRVINPTLKFSLIIQEYGPVKRPFTPGIHPTASVSPGAKLDPARVEVGANAVIESGASIGAGTSIQGGAFIGMDVVIGTDSVIHPNAVIKDRCIIGNRVIIHSAVVIGSDGFGYEFSEGRHKKIEQVGIVQIDDDVEIGSGTSIDRARFGRTWIGEGTKIDNLVQIGHNVVVGKHCIIVAQVGIAGSAHLGNYVTIAAQTGIVGHLHLADRVVVLARSGVTKNLTEPGAYTGWPARPLMEGRRLLALPGKIPDMNRRIKELEKKLAALEGKLDGA